MRNFAIFCLVLLVASFSLWAFPGRATSSPAIKPIDISDLEALPEEQKTDSGNLPETTLTEPSESSLVPEVVEKASEGRRLSGDEALALTEELLAAKADYRALEETSKAKDKAIDELAEENASLKDETGTKAYLMLDGIVGFSEGVPDYGLGLTLGTRVGNSLMLELGVDYMLGTSLLDVLDYSIDNWTFRAGIGWMF